jgi:hypothetical protein
MSMSNKYSVYRQHFAELVSSKYNLKCEFCVPALQTQDI